MRKVIVSVFVTLDGVMEAPGGEPGHPHSGWSSDFMTKDEFRYKLDEVLEAECLLLGRVTYSAFAEAWSKRSGEFADKMNAMRKHVVSTTLRETPWNNTRLIASNVAGEITRLKEQAGGPILVAGSRTLIHSLMELGLVDELRMMICPVLVGSGGRVFPETQRKTMLRLADMRKFDSGVVVSTYAPVAGGRA